MTEITIRSNNNIAIQKLIDFLQLFDFQILKKEKSKLMMKMKIFQLTMPKNPTLWLLQAFGKVVTSHKKNLDKKHGAIEDEKSTL